MQFDAPWIKRNDLFGRSLFDPLFIPADLPLRVVVPTIERYMLGKIPMISCRIDPKLFIDIQASSLVFPFQFRTPRLIDSITTGSPIETDRSRPPCTTHRPVAMLKD